MSILEKLTDRLLVFLGLDLDLSVSLGREPFSPIAEDLYLGARPDRAQASALKDVGITHVVSCLPEEAEASVAFLREGFRAIFIPMRDGVHENIAATFPLFFDFVRSAHQECEEAKVFVHCEVGVSRSATLMTALVMQRRQKRFYEAYCDVRAKRSEVLPNIGFASQLQQFEFEMYPRADSDHGVSSLARYLKDICMVPVELETLQDMLHQNDYDALRAVKAIFGEEIPRVIQGVRT